MIKLVAIDLDNTLLELDQSINQETIDTINKCLDKNIHIVLCTGRSLKGAQEISKLFNNRLDIICFNGAIISINNQIIFNDYLSFGISNNIIKYCNNNNLYVQFYDNDKIVSQKDKEEYIRDAEKAYCKEEMVDNLESVAAHLKSPKALINIKENLIPIHLSYLKENLKDCYVTQSMPHLIEIMNKGISKSKSLEKLLNYLKIENNETMAIGDNLNDLDMIKWAYVGASVSNAIEELKKESTYVCKNSRSKGVKEALEKYCLI